MQNLAPGSEWRIDPEDGSEFITGAEGHRIDVSTYEPKCIVMTVDEDEAAIGDVRDILAIIDRANLDPVRVGVREFLDTLHANDDTKHFDKSTLEALERLEAVL